MQRQQHRRDGHRDGDDQPEGVAQSLPGPALVALAQADAHEGGAADAHHIGEGADGGEGGGADADGGQGLFPGAGDAPHKDTVHDAVQQVEHLAHHGGHAQPQHQAGHRVPFHQLPGCGIFLHSFGAQDGTPPLARSSLPFCSRRDALFPSYSKSAKKQVRTRGEGAYLQGSVPFLHFPKGRKGRCFSVVVPFAGSGRFPH